MLGKFRGMKEGSGVQDRVHGGFIGVGVSSGGVGFGKGGTTGVGGNIGNWLKFPEIVLMF